LLAHDLIREVKGKDWRSHYHINDRKWPEFEATIENQFDVE